MSFYYINKDSGRTLLALDVYQTIAAGPQTFKTHTTKLPKIFEYKPLKYPPFLFAFINITKNATGFFLEQHNYTAKIDPIPNRASFEDLRTTKHCLTSITYTVPGILEGSNIFFK